MKEVDLFEQMDKALESSIEFVLFYLPYSYTDIINMDFAKFFRLIERAKKIQEQKIKQNGERRI